MQVTNMNDQELIALYLGGEERAFEELLNRHQQKIYTSIYLFVKEQSLAEDIFQEVFIKIIDTLRKGKYNHEGKFLQWAMRIAYNMCVDHFRSDGAADGAGGAAEAHDGPVDAARDLADGATQARFGIEYIAD